MITAGRRNCIIVGAGPGVGQAVAQRFGREGFRLALVARRAATLTQLVDELRGQGHAAHGFSADAGDTASLHTALDLIRSQVGEPDVLVYNATAGAPGLPSRIDPDGLLADLRVSVVGALVAAQQVIPAMQARGQGTILFTGGGLALHPWPQAASLAIGKAGLRNLAYSLGAELEPAGIHVATVTIAGSVQSGTHFDPDLIAEAYWQLHSQPRGRWEREIVYR
jgi:short-subunit dehydrogenase